MSSPPIVITQPKNGEVLTYPLVRIYGFTTDEKVEDVYLVNCYETNEDISYISCPVKRGKFTAVVHLRPESNTLRLSNTLQFIDSRVFSLFYRVPPPGPPYIRFVYLLAKDSDGSFQSPDPCHPEEAVQEGCKRLHTAGLLIQSAMAEMLHAEGFGRRTFRLAPDVLVHRMEKLTVSEAFETDEQTLFSLIYQELSEIPNRSDIIDAVVMSFTRKIEGRVYAHTALGGGFLALFGGASMFTWPVGVHDIVRAFQDTRSIDDHNFFDDSAGRATKLGRRACASTTIGLLLHEIGHCLSLPHPCGAAMAGGGGIMIRGFDFLDRLFIQQVGDDPLPFWDRGSATRLRFHKFLQFPEESLAHDCAFAVHLQTPVSSSVYKKDAEADGDSINSFSNLVSSPVPSPSAQPPSTKQGTQPNFEHFSAPFFKMTENNTVAITSECGLGHIGYYCNGDNASHDEFLDTNPRVYHLSTLSELRKRCEANITDRITISAIDIIGQITEMDYDKIQLETAD